MLKQTTMISESTRILSGNTGIVVNDTAVKTDHDGVGSRAGSFSVTTMMSESGFTVGAGIYYDDIELIHADGGGNHGDV